MKIAGFFAACILIFAAGCASYHAEVEPQQELGRYRRYWVKSNLNDNHSIDQLLVRALKQNGLEADFGPLTMMPETAQVLVTYRDYWAWDFKNHMVGLEVTIKDARNEKPLASANFTGAAALTTSAAEAVDRLVRDLMKPKPAKR